MWKATRWLPLVFLEFFLLTGVAIADDEGTVEVGITPNPLTISVSAPNVVFKGDDFVVRAQIRNLGDQRINDVTVTIHLDHKGLRLDRQRAEQYIGTIPPHRERTVNWSVEALKAGNYIILVSASGNWTTYELEAQDSVTIKVRERPHRFFGFFYQWWRHLFGREWAN